MNFSVYLSARIHVGMLLFTEEYNKIKFCVILK
jgi:hypothetical protein